MPPPNTNPLKTSLQFTGDLVPFLGLLLAAGLAALAYWLYRRETRDRADRMRWMLPTLRAAAVFLAVLALTGPILHHEKVIRELGKLFVFVDGSKSMTMTDETMAPERKVASMQAMGILPRAQAARDASAADALLSRARYTAERAIEAGPESPDLADAAERVHDDIEAAFKALENFDGKLEGIGNAPGLLLSERYPVDSRFFDKGFRNRPSEHPEPEQTRLVENFEFPQTTEPEFMIWMRGYFIPPTDGQYQFWFASDDRGELWLSRDENPKNADRIAGVSTYVTQRSYDENGNQRSRNLRLKKGSRYYIEAIMLAEHGENHLSVAVKVPGEEERIAPAPGALFSPFQPSDRSADGRLSDEFRDGLLARAENLENAAADGTGDPFAHIESLREISGSVSGIVGSLREYVLGAASAYHAANKDADAFGAKLAEFDALDRKSRVERLLLNPDTGVLPLLAEGQDVELLSLRDKEADSQWWQRRGGKKTAGPMPLEIELVGTGLETDLGEAVLGAVGDAESGVGVLVFTDGGHNAGSSPVAAAKQLGGQGIPVFTVGTGALRPPEDMAVIDIDAPATVFSKDRVKGAITVRDSMGAGEFVLQVRSGSAALWEETFNADGRGEREFEYDFPVEELVEAYRQEHAGDGIEYGSVPLSFDVQVKRVDDDAQTPAAATPTRRHLASNDSKPLFVQAVASARKVLLLDSRPRWETRYLHNMFERDGQWEVNAIMSAETWDRGDAEGTFPATREELFKYETIIIGDVPREQFADGELVWLSEFVENRGGGLVFIDGQRGNLRGYANTPVEALLPVTWRQEIVFDLPTKPEEMPESISLTSAGADFAPLRFSSTGAENEEIWSHLRPPHWSAGVDALPGAEVLAQTGFAGGKTSPAFVWRRVGAGKVLYSGTDELWRWRYNVADRYHQKFWVQIANWIGERPFSVAGPRASIGTEKLVYSPGSKASIRVRIRDEDGTPVTKGDYVAILYDADDTVAAEIELEEDDNGGGLFRGRTGELAPGQYEIAVRQKYFLKKAVEFEATAPLIVKAAADRELDDLALNRDLLADISRSSGGQYFAEEEARNLVDLLESIDQKKVIPSQTILWSSYWWFGAIIGLLTAEWILRKRSGYV